MRIHGGCHCGALRYEAEIDPAKAGICHCTDCQRLTGSAFSLFVAVPREHFRLVGEPRIYVKTAESGNRRAQLRPQIRLCCRSAQPWVNQLAAVRAMATQP